MKYKYTKTQITVDKLEDYSKLLSSVFVNTNKFTQAFLYWQYAKNPEGMALGFDAYFEGKLVAHYVTLPVCYLINGKKTKGLLSLNTAVHPKHQGKKLFTQLAQKTFDEAKLLGYDFIIGVANQNSTHGFIKKLGFYLISPLDVKIGFGKLNLKIKQSYKAKPFWSLKTLKWRLSNPYVSYFKNRNQVFVLAKRYGLYAQIYNMDDTLKFDDNLMKKAPFFKIWVGLAKKEKAFFTTFPSILKPAPLNLIFKDLKGNLPILKPNDIFFELIDFDAY